MNSILVRVSLALALLLASLFMLSCGASSNSRMLQSISVSPQTANGQVQFVATGTFNAPPFTVTPLPVNWCVQNPKSAQAALCGAFSPDVITSQGLANCETLAFSVTVNAEAPADPKLPLNTQAVPGVVGSATLVCP
jgi:hypothetical protein